MKRMNVLVFEDDDIRPRDKHLPFPGIMDFHTDCKEDLHKADMIVHIKGPIKTDGECTMRVLKSRTTHHGGQFKIKPFSRRSYERGL